MIDLTPLDIRNKRGDFKRLMRGYDPQEVDTFLEIAAERLEALIRENMALKERTGALQAQVDTQSGREQAVQAALVTAQELRADIRNQAQREAENIVKEAETEGRRLVAEAEAEVRTKLRGSERRLDQLDDSIREMERRRDRFLKEFRQLLERELDVVQVEAERTPLEERTIDLDLGQRRVEDAAERTAAAEPEPVDVPDVAQDASAAEGPPLDAPVDELATAFEPGLGLQTEASLDQPPREVEPPAPPGPKRRHDAPLLYPNPDDKKAES